MARIRIPLNFKQSLNRILLLPAAEEALLRFESTWLGPDTGLMGSMVDLVPGVFESGDTDPFGKLGEYGGAPAPVNVLFGEMGGGNSESVETCAGVRILDAPDAIPFPTSWARVWLLEKELDFPKFCLWSELSGLGFFSSEFFKKGCLLADSSVPCLAKDIPGFSRVVWLVISPFTAKLCLEGPDEGI